MTTEDSLQPPKWMVALENKQKRHHKLAHDIGAGAACLNCRDACLGLDLHFWRKLCRNCKCKKEAHDIKEEDSYEQFEILFGENGGLRNNEGMKKFAQDLAQKLENGPIMKQLMEALSKHQKENGLIFDWMPSNVPVTIASEYMQQLPLNKLPIAGTEGAVFRRQQLQKQIPLHDFNVNKCHDLSTEETEAFTDYVQNLKENVVGQGSITKVVPISDSKGENNNLQENESNNILQQNKSTFSKNLNITPKPFKPFTDKSVTEQRSLSPSLPDLLLPTLPLKQPSAFIKPTALPRDNSVTMPAYPSQTKLDNQLLMNLDTYNGINGGPKIQSNNKSISSTSHFHPNQPDICKPSESESLIDDCSNIRPSSIKKSQINSMNIQFDAPKGHNMQLSHNINDAHHMPTGKGIDGRICKVGTPGQFEAFTVNVNSSSPLVGDVSFYGSNNEADDRHKNNRVCFGDTTVIDVDHLTQRVNSLPPVTFDDDTTLTSQLFCHHCNKVVILDQVAVFIQKGNLELIWHPQCFVCNKCEELLVDLVYFYSGGHVYCGRHYAEVVNIPRCFACDELIFLKEYTVAEDQSYHVKHFCCFECDVPLAGMQYVPKDGNPVCLTCYNSKYGKKCHHCQNIIGASDSRLGFKELNWHATVTCFKCSQCSKSLLGQKFTVKYNEAFCSSNCVRQYKDDKHL